MHRHCLCQFTFNGPKHPFSTLISNKPSIQPFLDRLYIVPGTSAHLIQSINYDKWRKSIPCCVGTSKNGHLGLTPNPTAHGFFMARFATICSGEGSSGIPVSSTLNICEGLSSSSLSTKFLLQYIEVLT